MNNSMDKFLLSFMYAIKELETPLTSEETKKLKNIGQQLDNDPTAWEIYTEPMLKEIISNNSSLNKVFQNIQSNLENIGDIPQDFIPTNEELIAVTQSKNSREERPIPKFSPEDSENDEITNISIQVFFSPEPSETVKKISKKISKLEKLWDFISKNNSSNK
ncbi:MAG: hypothetical protein MGG11_09670 [Trichodesmium sp. MAG_R03]|nr:hypothetical protein [Trichodesmium sp. MAG_R03]